MARRRFKRMQYLGRGVSGALTTTFERLSVGQCFAYSPTAKAPTRKKVDARRAVTVPGGKRPLRVEDVDVSVNPLDCGGLGRVSVRCEVLATPKAKRKGQRMVYAGSFESCKAAQDYADWLKKNGHKATVRRK